MNDRFAEIYANDEWGHGSGEGSLVHHTKGYIAFLEGFLRQRSITSVVDMGCGDWQFSKHVRWGNARYQGYDVVPSVVSKNTQSFSSTNVEFKLYSGDPNQLPPADLLIVKDVLQHLPNEAIFNLLPCLPRFKYTLITNCINPKGPTENVDIQLGGFRYLDLRLPPFNLQATEVYSFAKKTNPIKGFFRAPEWKKLVLLVDGAPGALESDG